MMPGGRSYGPEPRRFARRPLVASLGVALVTWGVAVLSVVAFTRSYQMLPVGLGSLVMGAMLMAIGVGRRDRD